MTALCLFLSGGILGRGGEYVGRLLLPSEGVEGIVNRQALRLRTRIIQRHGTAPALAQLRETLHERRALFSHIVHIEFPAEDVPSPIAWDVTLQAYPLWLRYDPELDGGRFRIDTERIAGDLQHYGIPGVVGPRPATVLSWEQDALGVLRGTTDGFAEPGYTFDLPSATSAIAEALTERSLTLRIPLHLDRGTVTFSGDSTSELTLIASGRSNFAGSPWARKQNITKAVEQHINNVLVEPDAVFSFNALLGGPVTQGRGWYEALGIFEGENLRPTPGGGICQTSTTLYRAILAGGFPVLERRQHSLYVGYYRKYGVGIDATIFPGSQDLVFKNDTGHHLLLQAKVEGQDVQVNIFGVPDGRTVSLEGPYFSVNAPDDLRVYGRRLQKNEIAWVQWILRTDGTEESAVILSTYRKGIPVEQLLAEAQSAGKSA